MTERAKMTYFCSLCGTVLLKGLWCQDHPPVALCVGCGTPEIVCKENHPGPGWKWTGNEVPFEGEDICCGLCIHDIAIEHPESQDIEMTEEDFERREKKIESRRNDRVRA